MHDADESFYDEAACGLLVTAVDGTILRCNSTFCGWTGYAAEELIAKRRIQELLTMGGRVFHQTHWAPLLQMQGSVSEIQLEIIHRDLHTVPILLNAIRRRDESGVKDHIAVFVSTDRRKYEQELLAARERAETALIARREVDVRLLELNERLSEADRRKDEFLATLAHELRNPLAPMRNVLEILRLKNFDDPDLRWSQGVFERQLQQMTHLVDDLMEISRITQGRVELRKRRLDLVEAMQDAVETCMPLMHASSHTLTVILPAAPVFVDGDPTRLAQIMLNLLNNAAKYTPPGGRIQFVGERQDDQAVLTVIDSGIGIPDQHLSGVFQMFSQLAPALERSQGGLGIGLALVRGLVELHGGTVCASSKGEGRGSEFCVRLPVSQMEIEVAPASSDRPLAPAQGRRILLIDDNEDAIDSMAMVLQMLGHEVRTARDGMTGIAMGREFSPQVVLLDIGLPELNGYDVAKLIRNEAWGSHALLIAATGWGQREDKQAALDAGFDRHLTKPIDIADLDAIFRGID